MPQVSDWRGRTYEIEISYVGFLHGFVAWIDDEPYNEGEPFPSRRAAEAHINHEFRAGQ